MRLDGLLVVYDFGITNGIEYGTEYANWYDNMYLKKFQKAARTEEYMNQADLRWWMLESLRPIFQTDSKKVVFEGYSWYFRKVNRENCKIS